MPQAPTIPTLRKVREGWGHPRFFLGVSEIKRLARAEGFANHSGAKVQFYRVDQRNKPCQQCLMCRVLNVGVEGCFVLELHDAAKRIAFSARRNIGSHVGLKESRDYPLVSGNFF